jgi:acyl-CoA thioesterase-1
VSTCPYDPPAGLYVGGREFGFATAAAAPEVGDALLARLVRFEHPAKLLGVAELPGAGSLPDALVAAAYATRPDVLARLRDELAATARGAAEALLADPRLHAAAAAFPVGAGGLVVALGDSITDDLLSWAEILRHALAIARPGDAVTVVNAGVSGDTTADALRRLHGIVALRPELVITMLGTNDCQRHGPTGAPLADARASLRNLRAIAGWLRGHGAALAWLSPPPVLEPALAAAVGERPFAIRDADVAAVLDALAYCGGPVLDVRAALGGPLDAVLLDDGVHPSLEGQTRIAAGLLRMLGQSQNHSGSGSP